MPARKQGRALGRQVVDLGITTPIWTHWGLPANPANDLGALAWWESDDVSTSGSNVTAMNDQSSNNNDATTTGSPTLVSNQFNGHPAVRCVGSSSQVVYATGNVTAGAYTLVIYGTLSQTPSTACVFAGCSAGSGFKIGLTTGGNYGYSHMGQWDASTEETFVATPMLLIARRPAASAPDFYINNVGYTIYGSSALLDDAGSSAQMSIGSRWDGAWETPGSIDLGLAAFFASSLTDSQINTVLTPYINSKYALSLPSI